jgi:FKBP-type peptidyl-prolyl cis-trans isomerase 2
MHQVVEKNKHVQFSYSITDADSGKVHEQFETPIPHIHGGPQLMYDKVEAAMEGAGVGELSR